MSANDPEPETVERTGTSSVPEDPPAPSSAHTTEL